MRIITSLSTESNRDSDGPDDPLGVHRFEEGGVVLGLAQLLQQKFHGLDERLFVEELSENPYLVEVLLRYKQLLFPRSRAERSCLTLTSRL